jgi:hypothetical protein
MGDGMGGQVVVECVGGSISLVFNPSIKMDVDKMQTA